MNVSGITLIIFVAVFIVMTVQSNADNDLPVNYWRPLPPNTSPDSLQDKLPVGTSNLVVSASSGVSFFDNIELIRRKASRDGVPFSNIVLMTTFGSQTQADLRLQVYSALAYGISKVTYCNPLEPSVTFNESSEVINTDSSEQSVQISLINQQIRALSRTMCNLRSDAVYHTGSMTKECSPLPEEAVISSVCGADSIVGFFTGKNKERYIMVVNKDTTSDHEIKLIFRKQVTLHEISHLTGFSIQRGRNTDFTFPFKAGEGRLFQFTPYPQTLNPKPKVMLNPSVQYLNTVKDSEGHEVYNEGEVMWDIANLTKAILDKDGRVETYLSRKSRSSESTLYKECDLAKMIGCDVFVALHSDSSENESEGGTWSFYADDDSHRLADAINARVLAAIQTIYPEVASKGVKEHWNRLFVLHNAGCPSELTEILFHSNPKERELLKRQAFQKLVANAVARGILDYLDLK